MVPCSTSTGGIVVDTRIVSDGAQSLTIATQDSAGNWTSAARRVLVDNTAPAGPVELRSSAGDVWSAANSFSVAWTNPPQTGTAPIAAVLAAICPASNAIDDFRGCSRGSKTSANIRALSNLRVPGPGDWVARFWLQDAAGNSDWRTARQIHLRYDGDPPDAAILDANAADPTRVTVTASDELSGLAGVEIEIRRIGASTWTSLPVANDGGVFRALIDDAVLPAGQYAMRVRAWDHARNERSVEIRRSGAAAVLNLPLRVPTTLALGGVRKIRSGHGRTRTVLRRRPTADFGDPVPVRGRLTLPGNNPLAGVDLDVFEQTALPGEAWHRVGLVHTDASGWFSYKALRGPSRYVRFAYPGTALIQPRAGVVHLRVRAATSFHVSRRRVVNGDEVLFHGRVRGRLPRPGKLLQLQAYSRGTWRTFATPRAHRRSHRWRYRYRFSATRGIVRYRFRSVLPPEAGFPYVSGKSRQLRVTVRGL